MPCSQTQILTQLLIPKRVVWRSLMRRGMGLATGVCLQIWVREVEQGEYPSLNIWAKSLAFFGVVLLNGGLSVTLESGWTPCDRFLIPFGLMSDVYPLVTCLLEYLVFLPCHVLVNSHLFLIFVPTPFSKLTIDPWPFPLIS